MELEDQQKRPFQEDGELAVRVWQATGGTYVTNPNATVSIEPHVVLPAAYAAALVDVAEAARALDENYEGYSEAVPEILAEIRAALDRLDAAKATSWAAS